MAGANGGTDQDIQPGWGWDVALSFADAQRDYVEQVARALRVRGVRCFYDADEEIELWGKYLAEELPTIYGEQAAAAVVFVSAEYAARDWTRHERRAALGRAVRERREYVLPARFDDTPLPGLLPDMVTVDLRGRAPEQFAAMIAGKLAALAASAVSADAGGPAWSVRPARPAGAVRVSEADPRRLGVHAAISVPGAPDEVLPAYVPRDVDAGIRAKVTAATEERGGLVLLVGGSSVGKTRCAVEAVRALLPDWWLVHPAGPAEVAALAAAPPPRTVVWLDELQRYLDGEHRLTGGLVRALLNAPHPAVIIGTMWPDFYAAYTAMPVPGGADPHSREREVLELAAVVRIGAAFSPAEQDQARAAATRDPRLRVALDTVGYGLTQTLAAAPQLVARWEDAQAASPYGWAVLTAALEAARLGARAPLSAELLRAAAPGYCTSQQLAEAPESWFEQALAYAIGKLHGAVAPLSPAGSRIGQIDGYTVADYLIQHARWARHTARVPASTWDAVLRHIRDPADLSRLADSARRRLLYRYAIPLYRHAADVGDEYAAARLAIVLAERGDLDGAEQVVRARADAGDPRAGVTVAELLAGRGDLGGAEQVLRAAADAGDGEAARRLADLLAGRGDLGGAEQVLRAAADGDREAARRLAKMLADRGDIEELRARAAAGDPRAARALADLLVQRGDRGGAEQVLRAAAGDREAARLLVVLLDWRGDLGGAEQVLRAAADAGDGEAGWRLADRLAGRGDLDGLRARADAGDRSAARRLAELLVARGDRDGAERVAAAGDGETAVTVAEVLVARGDRDGAERVLRAAADAGDSEAVRRLAVLLGWQGDRDGAEQVLRAAADAGDPGAAVTVAEVLAKRGDRDGAERVLRAAADGDGREAAGLLAKMLADRGDVEELRARAADGDEAAARALAELLADRGDQEGLRAWVDVGDWEADGELAWMLAHLLTNLGLSRRPARA